LRSECLTWYKRSTEEQAMKPLNASLPQDPRIWSQQIGTLAATTRTPAPALDRLYAIVRHFEHRNRVREDTHDKMRANALMRD
jgi:hypothetical protein